MFRASWVCSRCCKQRSWHVSQVWPQGRRLQSTVSTAAADSIFLPLIDRARSIKTQHTDLSRSLETGYDADIAKKLGELSPVVTALKSWEKANESITELHSLLQDSDNDPELLDLARQDLDQSNQELQTAASTLTASLVPKHPFSDLPCLIEIRPGIGGSEAALFARDLLEMYQAFCAQNGLHDTLMKKEESSSADGENALTEAILEVESPGAYGILRGEAGVHRVQRVPATESKGRVHTSTVAVMILPSFPKVNSSIDINDPESDFYIDVKDVKRDYMRSNGPGGQHVNKTESAVRLTHLPTNTVVAVQETRTRAGNEEKAWGYLRSRIAQARREAREEETRILRRSVIGVAKVGRADKIRTYNWQQQRVTDHRSGYTIHGLDGLMDGGVNLAKLMDSVRNWQANLDIEEMLAISAAEEIKQK